MQFLIVFSLLWFAALDKSISIGLIELNKCYLIGLSKFRFGTLRKGSNFYQTSFVMWVPKLSRVTYKSLNSW